MTPQHIVATWFVADPATEEAEVESWCDSLSPTDADVLVQIATGRGQLAGGRGALLVRERGAASEVSVPGWCVNRIDAEFRLRQVNAPHDEPVVAATPCMLLTRTFVPAEMRDEFRTWLEQEHSQRQLDVPGNNWYIGYEEIGGRESLMNFWGIDEAGVASGPAWDQRRLTPWRERMVPAMAGMDRAFYRPRPSASEG